MLRRDSTPARRRQIKRTLLARRWSATGPTPDTVALVLARDGRRCVACSSPVGPRRGVDHHIHHRRPRAAGGTRRHDTNQPQNLLLLCAPCHADVESRRADAVSSGWLVSQYADPALVPVLVDRGSRWVYLTADGEYADEPPYCGDELHGADGGECPGCGWVSHPIPDEPGEPYGPAPWEVG